MRCMVSMVMKQRDTNIELFRCVVMLLIVAHHYMMHSGLLTVTPGNLTSVNSVYLYLFGMWGKVGINCFVLITGYFMCQSSISLPKYMKLLLQVVFYKVLITICFIVSGTQEFSIKEALLTLLPFTDIDNGFVDCFMVFYLFIPFLNILIHSMTEKQHRSLISLCLFVFCFWPQLHVFKVNSNYVVWFSVIYIIASYIRIYEIDRKLPFYMWSRITIMMIIIACGSVIFLLMCGRQWPLFLVYDCNSVLAVVVSVASFVYFKQMPIHYHRWINIIASSTFGILLIHDCNWTMRQWLWVDLLKCTEWFERNIFFHSILSVLGVFLICSVVDLLRLHFLERPLFKYLTK